MSISVRARLCILALVLVAPATVTVGAAPVRVIVSNGNDSGDGSFRRAIEQANANDSMKTILFLSRASVIELSQTIWYTGNQDLTIVGNGSTLDGANANGPAFLASGGGDLSLSNLNFRNSPAEGISVDVPSFATGTVRITLIDVGVSDNASHGVLVNEQDDPATLPIERNSAASVDVTVVNSRFTDNGFSAIDRDGLRVNEGGDGDLAITLLFTRSSDNGADGVEADERGAGDVKVHMLGSHVTGNGSFTTADLDDGFDIDESDDGSIVGLVAFSSANDNFEQGFDFNENHAGDLRVDMLQVEANGNLQEGIEYEEDDDVAGGGDIVTQMLWVTANGNGCVPPEPLCVGAGDAGFKLREKGDGDLDATVTNIEAAQNKIGGIHIREDATGSLVSSLVRATALQNASHGIDFDENGAGDLTAKVTKSTSSGNGGAGVRADQQLAGLGTLELSAVVLNGNTGGATSGNNVTVTVNP